MAGSPVAQQVKRWTADVASRIPAGGGNLFCRKRGSNAHILSLSPFQRADMTELIENKTQKCKSSIYASIYRIHVVFYIP